MASRFRERGLLRDTVNTGAVGKTAAPRDFPQLPGYSPLWRSEKRAEGRGIIRKLLCGAPVLLSLKSYEITAASEKKRRQVKDRERAVPGPALPSFGQDPVRQILKS